MKKIKICFIIVFTLIMSILNAQTAFKDYLNIGEKISFNGEDYYFGWSSKPQSNYYIEEFFPKGETPEKYNKMMTVSVLISDEANPENALKAKAYELEQRKKNDPVCGYMVLNNKDEYILGFIVSDSDGKVTNTVEWDIHYYKAMKINGKNAIKLTFYSQRAYGDNVLPFLNNLKTERDKLILEMTKTDYDCSLKE